MAVTAEGVRGERRPVDFVDVGRLLSEEEKWAVIAGAALTIHPSLYESLSLALLESWAVGVPAVVNGLCAVLLGHAREAAG